VLSIFEDRDGNLWLGLDNGISIVNLNSAFRVYKDTRGRLGAVYASITAGDWLYIGTNQGLFCKRSDEPGGFRMVRGTNGQVWSLKSEYGTVFCGHNKGTFTVEEDRAVLISDFSGTWDLLPVPGREHLLVQGNYSGLSVLENRKGGWVFRNRIRGFDISSKSLVFTTRSEITVNHEFKGLFRLEIDPDLREVVQTTTLGRISYDSNISKFGERILFSSNEGVHVLDPATGELVYDQFLSDVFYNLEDRIRGKLIVEPREGKLWGFSELNVICLEQDPFDGKPGVRKIPIPKFFRQNQGLTGFENLYPMGDSKYLIGTSTGYVVLNLNDIEQADYEVEITGVRKKVLNGELESVALNEASTFRFEENNISFSLSVPEYEKYTEVDYQYKLSGRNDEWSSWSPVSEVSFGNLPFGDYTFKVRARIGNELSANEASYSFVIKRPWYLSWWVLGVYLVLFAGLMAVIHRSYKRYYSRQRVKLIEENQKNLELARLAGEQEIIKLKNEQLQKDIEVKNRELAMTTMSLINKSELLNGIKNDLSNLQDKSSRDQVIKVINRNLNNDHDWEYFQEAFNNADKDFLKKMHELHPNLTPNDLKLCVYLRLNLSSKEIAPLLNISVRSVEIKRYRLRKKMNLEHEKSLVEYILEI
jgi:DNA-binding CsgD family transcriptional regulator